MASPRLLVVMDDEIARGLLVTVLRAHGHTVDAAAFVAGSPFAPTSPTS